MAQKRTVTAFFADPFCWIALSDSSDLAHAKALTLTRQMRTSPIITTDEVLTEYRTFFASASPRACQAAVDLVERLLQSPSIRVIPQTRDSFQAGLELYKLRPDKQFSLVDCISMNTMRREGLSEVLTNDRHFEQEGFRALFRD
jgi:predicted nucleic acid-binding protein